MADVVVTLNVPAGDGVGAISNVAAMGATKTIIVTGIFTGVLFVQVSANGVDFIDFSTVTAAGKQTLQVACTDMRVRRGGTNGGALPTVDVGSDDAGTLAAAVVVPAGTATGASVNISAFGMFTTVIVTGSFGGSIILQASEDGVDFVDQTNFSTPNLISTVETALFVRARSVGVTGSPVMVVAGANDSAVVVSTIIVQDEGIAVGTQPAINFIGAAVTAVNDGGNNRVNVTVSAAALAVVAPTTILPDDAAAVGVATDAARADHLHGIAAAAPGAIAVGDVAAEGVSTSFSRADHLHGLAAPAAPANVTKAAASAGAATTVARADHKHDVDTAAPGTITPDDAAVEGVATSLARSDHQHAIVAATPVTVGTANAEGAATSFARSDHVHDHGAQAIGAGTQHAAATTALAGFMSAADKTKLDGIASGAGSAIFAWGNSSISSGADTRFLDTWYNQAIAPTTAIEFVAPRAGTFRNLFVRHNVAAGNGASVVYTVMINGVATAITVTLATNAVGQTSDLVNSAAVAQGDRLTLRAVKAASIGNGTQEVTATIEFRN